MVYVFNDQETKDVVYARRNFTNGLGLIYTYDQGQWQGDLPLKLGDDNISLEEALKKVKEANILQPATRWVTFRSPANGEYFEPHAYYVFGGDQSAKTTICVDAITGNVFDVPKSSLGDE